MHILLLCLSKRDLLHLLGRRHGCSRLGASLLRLLLRCRKLRMRCCFLAGQLLLQLLAFQLSACCCLCRCCFHGCKGSIPLRQLLLEFRFHLQCPLRGESGICLKCCITASPMEVEAPESFWPR